MNKLYDELPEEERQGEEESVPFKCFTVGESLAMQFSYGNWSNSVTKMEELDVSAREFYEYLEESASDMGYLVSDEHYYNGHFGGLFFIELAEHFVRRSMLRKSLEIAMRDYNE